MKKIIFTSLFFISININAQKKYITPTDSFNTYLLEKSLLQRRAGKTIMKVSGVLFVGTILYSNLGKPDAPDLTSYPTPSQMASANSKYQRSYEMFQLKRSALGIVSGFLFVTGSVMRAQGFLRRDLYLSRRYSAGIGLQDNGIGFCINF